MSTIAAGDGASLVQPACRNSARDWWVNGRLGNLPNGKRKTWNVFSLVRDERRTVRVKDEMALIVVVISDA